MLSLTGDCGNDVVLFPQLRKNRPSRSDFSISGLAEHVHRYFIDRVQNQNLRFLSAAMGLAIQIRQINVNIENSVNLI